VRIEVFDVYAPGEPHLLPILTLREYPSINREVVDGKTAGFSCEQVVRSGHALAVADRGLV
jgi:hypothetical protein